MLIHRGWHIEDSAPFRIFGHRHLLIAAFTTQDAAVEALDYSIDFGYPRKHGAFRYFERMDASPDHWTYADFHLELVGSHTCSERYLVRHDDSMRFPWFVADGLFSALSLIDGLMDNGASGTSSLPGTMRS